MEFCFKKSIHRMHIIQKQALKKNRSYILQMVYLIIHVTLKIWWHDLPCKILADDNATVTVKLADAEHDAEHAFFYDNNVALTASTPFTYKQSPISPDVDYNATMLIFDFGRTPAGTQVTVSDIVLREIL